ncbi:ParA family protein [Microbacterium xanthum]|uniref:ParA family protein n=1 Tax=Microbacterium xanthum TaxID=3079794 RepID=UPI002AD33F9A|nr:MULTISPECIES: ParA family protein [unclassified Microbacterium]MDZ8173256.1 ParA family protein [Microbacterium sp. KSW-48]MDZ8202749.1 ParA family protein [Microbacterium sp. SSW1-59]
MSIHRTVTVAQGKGGVGKTSLVSNIGGLTAAAGNRVLILDLDQQGNVARDLGYSPDAGDDLLTALITSAPLPVLRGVRDRLDVVPGGPALGDVAAVMASRAQRGGEDLADVLEAKLRAIADDYDLILIDTPPGDRIIVTAALTVSRAVIIPTRPDEASIDGVTRIAERFLDVRERNPSLRLAGVALFAIASRTTRLERDVRASLAQVLGDAAPVFTTRIRHLDSAAADARRRGLLVHELEAAAIDDRAARISALRSGTTPTGGLYARDASGLATDYENIARELLTRVAEIEQEVSLAS